MIETSLNLTASTVLKAFLCSFNHGVDDETRQRLKPYIDRVIGTAGDQSADERRAWMATDWLVRVCAPAFMDLAGLKSEAKAMRELAPITKPLTGAEMSAVLNGRKQCIGGDGGAGATAWDATGGAAWFAARAIPGLGAKDAPEADAWAAAKAVAKAASRVGSWAAWAVARDVATRDTLKPTVKLLQESAFELLDRMIDA